MVKKNYYLFLDIDNTLFSGKRGIVPASALKAIQLARQNGSKVFLCSGRSKAEAAKYINYPVDGFVLGSGAWCMAEGNLVFDHPICNKDVNAISSLINQCEMGLLIAGQKHAYLDRKCYQDIKYYVSGGKTDPRQQEEEMKANHMISMKDRDYNDPICKMGASISHNESAEVLSSLLFEPYTMHMTLSSQECDFYEITNGTILKSVGIKKIMDYYNADINLSVGIGDSSNDIDMIKTCGFGIAMGNAFKEVKQIADWITTDIDEDGIWNAFKYLGVI